MSILIKGAAMPESGYVCLKLFANGDVFMTREHLGRLVITGMNERVGTALPISQHGRLIDADAFLDDLVFPSKQFEQGMRELVADAPTIIPAEEGDHHGNAQT